jgi:hypothetical protein
MVCGRRQSGLIVCILPFTIQGINASGLVFDASITYDISIFFRTSGPANVSVGLFLGLKALASIEIPIPLASDWQLFNLSLTPSLSTNSGTFVVSMVPDTMNNRARVQNGQCDAGADGGISVGVDLALLQPRTPPSRLAPPHPSL